MSAGQNEMRHGGERIFHPVYFLFEQDDIGRRYSVDVQAWLTVLERFLFRRCGEHGAHGKEFVLYGCEYGLVNVVDFLVAQQADVRIEFIERAVAFDADVVLGHALAAE